MAMLLCSFFSCQSESGDSIAQSVVGDQDEDSTTATIDSSYRYQLPVIFHVLYSNRNDTNQYVSYKRIKEILQNVNELWKGGYYDSEKLGLSQDMGVDFVLANCDENGKRLSQPGVEYIQYSGTYPIDPYDFLDKESNKKYMWEPSEYINVMLFNFEQSDDDQTTLGVTNMPYTYKDHHELEGLQTAKYKNLSKKNLSFCYCSCINSTYQSRRYESSRYSYYNSDSYYMIAQDINNTVAHELGHYLGLYHVFTEKKTDSGSEPVDSCGDTDYCEDTPSYNYYEYHTFLQDFINKNKDQQITMNDIGWRSNCDGETYTATNFMDYWVCYNNRFTANQKERVRHVLYYSPLIPGPKLDAPGSSSTRANEEEEELLPKPSIVK